MKFEVIKTSYGFYTPEKSFEIELNTLEELIDWCKKQNSEVIIREDLMLEIYDDYRE